MGSNQPISARELDKDELEQHMKNLSVYGYTVIPSYLSEETTHAALEVVESSFHKIQDISLDGTRERDDLDKVVYNVQNKSKYLIDLLNLSSLRTILMKFLNDPFYRFLPEDVPNYTLAYYNARSSGRKLDLHIDSWVPASGPYTWMMQAGFVLEDQDAENGCTILVPGSHQLARFTDRDLDEVKEVHSKAGDLVMWDSRIWHGTRENVSTRTRWALIATYSMWWLKPLMDMTRSLPEEIYQQLTDEQKALFGFCSIPPFDEFERINTKCGYDVLKDSVADYYS